MDDTDPAFVVLSNSIGSVEDYASGLALCELGSLVSILRSPTVPSGTRSK